MKIETKTYVIIVLTLVIGMIIGALITGAIVRHRIRRFMSLGHPDHLTARIERIIEPTEAQRDTVHQILMDHARKFDQIHGRFESQLLALKDSLKKDLDPILTEEQKERLERVPRPPEHFRGHRPGGRKDHRPGAPAPSGLESPGEERPGEGQPAPMETGGAPPPPPHGDQSPPPPPHKDQLPPPPPGENNP